METLRPNELCIFEGCPRSRVERGLCARHYTVARKLVHRGQTTFEEMVDLGLILPASHSGKRGDFYNAILAKQAEREKQSPPLPPANGQANDKPPATFPNRLGVAIPAACSGGCDDEIDFQRNGGCGI
jgi:hypothetical protein